MADISLPRIRSAFAIERCKEASERWYEKNSAKAKTRSKEWYEAHLAYGREKRRQYYHEDPERSKAHNRKWVKANPERKMLSQIRSRAKKNGILFDLTLNDIVIPPTCPILGIPIVIGGRQSDNAPSIDRIDNEKGYIKDNVIIISWRANRLKSDASVAELIKIATFYSQLTDSIGS